MAGNTVIFPPKQNAIDATQVKNIAKFKCIKLSANTATVVIESDKITTFNLPNLSDKAPNIILPAVLNIATIATAFSATSGVSTTSLLFYFVKILI